MRTIVFVLLLFCLGVLPSSTETPDHWIEVQTPHFTVLSNTNEKEARKVAGQFEQMRAVFHLLVPNAQGDTGVQNVVLALKDKRSFEALEPAAYKAKNSLELAGYFMRTPEKAFIMMRLDAQGEHPFATVYHEYTHELLSKSPWVPLWMNEGLAEFYQNTDIRDKDVLLGQPSSDDILYLREHPLIPLATLLAVDQQSPYYHDEQKGSVFYAESWALMHYIEVTDFQNNTSRLHDYAVRLIRGEDAVTAAKETFGDLNALQDRLDVYVRRMMFSAFRMKSAVPVDVASFTAKPLMEPEANSVRAEVLASVGRTKEAEDLATACLRDDPNSAAAREVMGELRFRANDIEGATKWYGEAVKLDSQSYLANYYYAVFSLQQGDRDHDAEIEASLRSAIKLQPEFAPSYDALAQFLAQRSQKLDEAHMLTLQAVQLEPQNIRFRMNAAQVLVEQRQYDSALRVLEAAAKVAKTPTDNAIVQVRIEQLSQYQNAVAAGRREAASAGSTAAAPQRGAVSMDGIAVTHEVAVHDQNSGKVVATITTSGKEDGRTMTVLAHEGGKTVNMAKMDLKDNPKYPSGTVTGAKHVATGTIHGVECAYPSVLTVHLQQPNGKTMALYSNNFYKLEFTTANFTPQGDIQPCAGIDGLKAKISYTEVTDERVAGQMSSIELSK